MFGGRRSSMSQSTFDDHANKISTGFGASTIYLFSLVLADEQNDW